MPDFADARVSLAGQGCLTGAAVTASGSGACLARVAGLTVTVRVLAGVTVAAGDPLLILREGSTYWVVGVTPAAPTTPPTPGPPPDDPPDSGDPAPAPKPTTRTGTLTCPPASTATFRDGHWRTDIGPVDSADLYQGRYGGSSFGRNTGVAFYGSKPRSLAGATVTKATIHVRRERGSGDYAARTATLRLIEERTRPSGAPTLHESTSGPSLKVGQTLNAFAIPTSWAQQMVDGTRGGLAISIGSDSPYIQLAGRRSWSAAWTLVISWRRDG
jgi:hypothetical protein